MGTAMHDHNHCELHQLHVRKKEMGVTEKLDLGTLPCRPDEAKASGNVLAIGRGDGAVWVTVDQESGALRVAGAGDEVVAGFQVVVGKLRDVLTMFPRSEDVLVDAMEALPVSVLHTKSHLALGPDCTCYVTQRITPYFGPPAGEMIQNKTKCSLCGIRLSAEPDPETGFVTRVITCQCGAVYHCESNESHPGVAADDLLDCREKIAQCIVCQRPVHTESFLVWDPATR